MSQDILPAQINAPGGNTKYLREDQTWQVPPGTAGGAVWGGITGVLSAQADLQTALDAKVPFNNGANDTELVAGSYSWTIGATLKGWLTSGSWVINNALEVRGDVQLGYDNTHSTSIIGDLTVNGYAHLRAATAIDGAGLRVPPGVAPTTPANGDVWTTAAGMYVRINGVTVGPLSAATTGMLPLTGGVLAGPGNLTVGGTLAVNGSATLGDAAADTHAIVGSLNMSQGTLTVTQVAAAAVSAINAVGDTGNDARVTARLTTALAAATSPSFQTYADIPPVLGDRIGQLVFSTIRGAGGANVNAGGIFLKALETFTSAACGSALQFNVVPVGTNAASQVAQLDWVNGFAVNAIVTSAGMRAIGTSPARFECSGAAAPPGAAGTGVEIFSGGGNGWLTAYNRTTALDIPLYLSGLELRFNAGGAQRMTLTSTALTANVPIEMSSGYKLTSYVSEKAFQVYFPAMVANQKVQIYWPTGVRFQGKIEVEVTSGYENVSASGYIKRTFALWATEAGSLQMLDGFSESYGYTAGAFTIANPQWDATNSRWYIVVAALTANAQNIGISVRTHNYPGGTSMWQNAAAANALLSAVYTTDTTVHAGLGQTFHKFGNLSCAMTTTASAANVNSSADGAALLRSTSALRYKQDIKAITPVEAHKLRSVKPIQFRSRSEADDPDVIHYGFIAEDMEQAGLTPLVAYAYQEDQVEPGLSGMAPIPREGEIPRADGVQYERVVVLQQLLINELFEKVAALEAAAGVKS